MPSSYERPKKTWAEQYSENELEGLESANFDDVVVPGTEPPPPKADNPNSTLDDPVEAPGQDFAIGAPGSSDLLDPYDGLLESDKSKGKNNRKMREKQPEYLAAPCEKVISGENNTHIVLGRDRPGKLKEFGGYGSKGHTRSGAIDIIVGLQGWNPAEGGRTKKNGNWEAGSADKNFGIFDDANNPGDAARIYLSQRADIDSYFNICDGFMGKSFSNSAIAMKADDIRILARKGIKIVTQKNSPGANSLGGEIGSTYGIELIAGNMDGHHGLEGLLSFGNPDLFVKRQTSYLQPIPKGDNLQEYLERLHDNVQFINSVLSGLIQIIWKIAESTITPDAAIGPTTAGAFTVPPPTDFKNYFEFLILSIKQWLKLYTVRQEMFAYKVDYLQPIGALYINSRYNRTN